MISVVFKGDIDSNEKISVSIVIKWDAKLESVKVMYYQEKSIKVILFSQLDEKK